MMVDIRRALVSDHEEIVFIEQQAGFSHWNESQIKQSIENDIVWVVEQQKQIIAFAVFTYVLDESELLNIVVLPEKQGLGIAKCLMLTALQELRGMHIVKCFLEVAVSNAPAIRLYEKLGFQRLTVRKNYYSRPDGKEDALIMQFELVAH